MVKVCFDLESSVEQMDQFNLVAGGELTISGGAVTITKSLHTIDTEADAVTDDLVTINGGSAGDVLLLNRANEQRAVILKHATGNIRTPSGTDHELTALGFVILKHDGSNWQLLAGTGSGYVVNKLSCLAAATTNVSLNGEQIIDGVFCGAEKRVFLPNQTDPKENGPWIVKAVNYYDPGAWVRPPDFQDGFTVSGHAFHIEQGNENTDTVWMIVNHYGQDLVGTDDLNPINLTRGDFDINSLPAESSNDNADLIAIYDSSAGAMRKQTRAEFLAGVAGGSGVPDTRSITAGVGLSGGGDLSADRTIDLDINELTTEAIASDTDLIAIYDSSAGAIRKQTRANFLAGIGGGVSESQTITAGIGLSGGGDLSADRTINLDINSLTAESTIDNSDLIAIYDASAGAIRKQTRSEFLAGITTGFVPTSTAVNSGPGLTGGGALSTDRTLSLDINGLTAEATPNDADLIAIYDVSAAAVRKQTRAQFFDNVFLVDGTKGYTGSQFTFTDLPVGSILAASIAAPQITREFHTDSGFFFGDSGASGISISGVQVFGWTALSNVSQNPLHCEDELQVDGISKLNAIRFLAQSADPTPAPADGQGYLWISDGTGSGDAGDLMFTVRTGGVTKTVTLVDYSTS
ncbi:hypothetical protein [Gimesia aquarii]|uniref:Uncharacterized protein n=1 Tax=Gimesia aquarii TaxID=2527964 RepID=A0A517VRI7_9PLAN|nr:hypothetical protein [Gimesia aquarii]QDT95559.1 hypothetical protein V144x_10040 [Gimesia aquarii]